MAGTKRKRTGKDVFGTPNQAETPVDMPKYTTGKALRDAIQLGSKDHLRAAEYQIRVPHSIQPVAITHPTILLIQNYLALSPTLDDLFSAWRKGHERRDQDIEAASVHLLASIIHSLTPIPYFQTLLEGLAEKVLETGGPWAGWLNSLISSSTRDLALPGLSLASALLNISSLSTTLSLGFGQTPSTSTTSASATRLNTKIWQLLIEGGSLRSLPKSLSMRRKGGFAIGADPLDKPDIRHNALNLLLPLLSNPTFLSGCKPLLPSIFSNLASDPPITIVRVLSSIWSAINASAIPAVNRKTASTLLTEQSIEGIVKLYARDGSGPDDIIKGITRGASSDKDDAGTPVAEVAQTFLMAVCTKPGVGICFPDNGWYRRKGKERSDVAGGVSAADEADSMTDGVQGAENATGLGTGGSFVHNRTLNNIVRKIGSRVSEDSKIAALVEGILAACPELVASYWPYSGVSLDPKLSARWIATISFIGRVIASPVPSETTFRVQDGERSRDAATHRPPKIVAPPLQALVEAILPSPLSKHNLSKGLQGSVGLIQHLCALTLARALQKLARVQALMVRMGRELESETGDTKGDNSWFARLRELELEMRKRVPDVPVIVTFAQRSAASQALQASLDDGDLAAKAKAELLTESALRLFQLYYETMPSMASELRFDVGKLLVSSSNAKQEAELRRGSREDSVFSETGSIASMGTIGTIGMGGGFGQARGNVEGFDALSQVHVLELLANVKEWSWTSKASGSTHSYLFHVLQLYLSTPHPVTKTKTQQLLYDSIGSSVLFEHDPEELDLWLQALPDTRHPSVPAPAALVLHQTRLLDFLDDCARRCVKTPFRYAELASQRTGLAPASGQARPSLLLFAVFEQLEAKIGGHHISADGALGVILFVKLLVILLQEKGVSSEQCDDLMLRMVEIVQQAAEKRGVDLDQLRLGASSAYDQVHELTDPRRSAQGAIRTGPANNFDGLDQVEQTRWVLLQDGTATRRGIPPAALDAVAMAGVPLATILSLSPPGDGGVQDISERIAQSLPLRSRPRRLAGYAGVCVQYISRPLGRGVALKLLLNVLEAARATNVCGVSADVHAVIFGGQAISRLIMSDTSANMQTDLSSIIRYLDLRVSSDEELARYFLESVMQGDVAPQQAVSLLRALSSLTVLLNPDQATWILSRLPDWPLSQFNALHPVLGSVVLRLSPQIILGSQFPTIRKYSLYGYAARACNRDMKARMSPERVAPARVAADVLKLLWTDSQEGQAGAAALLAILISQDRTTRNAFAALVRSKHNWSYALAETAVVLSRLDLEFWRDLLGSSDDQAPLWLIHVVDSVFGREATDKARSDGLVHILHTLSALPNARAAISGRIQEVFQANRFVPSVASLAVVTHLLSGSLEPSSTIARSVGDAMLKWMIKNVAGSKALNQADLSILESFVTLSRACLDKQLSGYFAEPILTAVVQDRLREKVPVDLAASLCRTADLKASVIRQHLQLLYDTPEWRALSRGRGANDNRRGIIALVKALFLASPYISCQAAFIEPLVDAYGGTTSAQDSDILQIFHLFERQTRTSSTSILCRWRMSGTSGRSSTPNALEAIKSLDAQQVFAACILSERKDGSYRHPVSLSSDFSALDATFLLGLYGAFLRADAATGLDWVEVIRSGILGTLVVALSSKMAGVRAIASRELAVTLSRIQAVPFHEQASLLRILRLARHATESDDAKIPERLPFVSTLFLAHALRAVAEPASFLFPLSSRFLLQRPTLDVRDVPMLYGMLYAAGQSGRKERRWMARFVRDSIRGESDWRILQRRHTFALLSTISDSSHDSNLRHIALQAVQAISFVPSAAMVLTEKEGLVHWLRQQIVPSLDPADQQLIIAVLENVIVNLNHRDQRREEAAVTEQGKAELRSGRRRRWTEGLEAVLSALSDQADIATLAQVATLILRSSKAMAPTGLETCTRQLTSSLRTLAKGEEGESTRNVCRIALQCGLDIDPAHCADLAGLAADLGWLASRTAAVEDEVGLWAQARLAA